jgi:hypothetical protein
MTAGEEYFVARHETTDYLNIPVIWDTTSADRPVRSDVSESGAASIFRAVYFLGYPDDEANKLLPNAGSVCRSTRRRVPAGGEF